MGLTPLKQTLILRSNDLLLRHVQHYIFPRILDCRNSKRRRWRRPRSHRTRIRFHDLYHQLFLLGRLLITSLHLWKLTKKAVILLCFCWLHNLVVFDGTILPAFTANNTRSSYFGISHSRNLPSFCFHPNHPWDDRKAPSRSRNCRRWRRSVGLQT